MPHSPIARRIVALERFAVRAMRTAAKHLAELEAMGLSSTPRKYRKRKAKTEKPAKAPKTPKQPKGLKRASEEKDDE